MEFKDTLDQFYEVAEDTVKKYPQILNLEWSPKSEKKVAKLIKKHHKLIKPDYRAIARLIFITMLRYYIEKFDAKNIPVLSIDKVVFAKNFKNQEYYKSFEQFVNINKAELELCKKPEELLPIIKKYYLVSEYVATYILNELSCLS